MTQAEAAALVAKLSPRERELLSLFCRGCIGRRAAKHMGYIHENTVTYHRNNLLRKMDALSISEATYIAGKSGVV